VPRRISKAKPQPQSKYKSRRKSQQQPASTPPPVHASISVHTSSPSPSPPPSSPDVDSLAGLPLTILPAPARTEIVVPPRALSHLQTSSTPPSDDSRTQQMQRQAIRQGFCYEGSATGAHGLLAKILPPPPNLLLHSLTRRLRHHIWFLVWILTLILTSLWASRTRMGMGMG
jgi:hypothetical protein